jgi:hemolysin activation/secretion protein
MTALPSGPKVNVKQIEVMGNRVIDVATLAALVADGAGKTLSLPELEALAQRITKHYRAKGYFVARAYIPAQEISSGTVRIRVVEGNYGQFHLKNKSLVRNDIVQGMLDDVKGTDIVALDTLERAMLIINDTPGVRVTRADVMPGTKVGTSDFAVDPEATAAYNG